MLSDDVYRSQLAATFADLKRAAEPFADVALIDSAATPDFVRLSLVPNADGACAVEVMLRADQLYDISLANEFYEDCKIQDFAQFEPLILAITRGDVIQRRTFSAATDTERAIDTIITLPNGQIWRKGHIHNDVPTAISSDCASSSSTGKFATERGKYAYAVRCPDTSPPTRGSTWWK